MYSTEINLTEKSTFFQQAYELARGDIHTGVATQIHQLEQQAPKTESDDFSLVWDLFVSGADDVSYQEMLDLG